jgi:hypothetical protein
MSGVVDTLTGSSGSGSSNFIAQSMLGALNLGGGKRPRSVTQYDNAEIDKLSSSLLFEVIAATFVHFFNKNNVPLLMLPLMGVSKTLKAPIVLIHLFRMQPVGPLGRPFKSGIEGMLQSLSGPDSATTAAATTTTTTKEAASTVPFGSTATKEGIQQVYDVLQPIATPEKSVSVSDSIHSKGSGKLDMAKKGKGKRKKKMKSANASGSNATGGDSTAKASKRVNVPKSSATTSAVVSSEEMSNEILQEVVTGEEEKEEQILPSTNNAVEVQQLEGEEEKKDVEVEKEDASEKKEGGGDKEADGNVDGGNVVDEGGIEGVGREIEGKEHQAFSEEDLIAAIDQLGE